MPLHVFQDYIVLVNGEKKVKVGSLIIELTFDPADKILVSGRRGSWRHNLIFSILKSETKMGKRYNQSPPPSYFSTACNSQLKKRFFFFLFFKGESIFKIICPQATSVKSMEAWILPEKLLLQL